MLHGPNAEEKSKLLLLKKKKKANVVEVLH
jgi:hypothetical protein